MEAIRTKTKNIVEDKKRKKVNDISSICIYFKKEHLCQALIWVLLHCILLNKAGHLLQNASNQPVEMDVQM